MQTYWLNYQSWMLWKETERGMKQKQRKSMEFRTQKRIINWLKQEKNIFKKTANQWEICCKIGCLIVISSLIIHRLSSKHNSNSLFHSYKINLAKQSQQQSKLLLEITFLAMSQHRSMAVKELAVVLHINFLLNKKSMMPTKSRSLSQTHLNLQHLFSARNWEKTLQ